MELNTYTTIEDFETLIRPLKEGEQAKVEKLLMIVEDKLRMRAHMLGKDLDVMIENGIIYNSVLVGTVCGIAMRYMNQDVVNPSASQMSQSANGYSISWSPISSGDIFIKDSEYSSLGLKTRAKKMKIHEMC